ncbi:PKD domain protein [anaerobic digester metagenome]
MANYYHLYMSLFRMDTRGSTFLLLAILVATCAAVFLAGCTGTPSGGSNQTAVPTALAGNTSAANASAAPGANETAAGLGAIMAGTPVQEASVSSVQKATQAGAPTSGTTPVSPTPTKCTTDFTASITSGVAPLTVTFTATAPCDAQKRTWVFGDGGPMASIEGAKVETYTYDTPGTYTVKLSEKFYSDDPADTLGFYASEKEKVGYVIVTGTTSATGTASITGTTSAKGTATVTGTASVTGTTTVSPTPTHCQADFTASVTSGPAPLTVTFTRTAPCASQKRNWNFGDGGPMSSIEGGPVETYTYETPGTYTVSLYEKFYTDDNIEGFYGDTETKVGYITVTKGLVVNPSLHITHLPTLKATPLVTLVKPGITLPKEKKEIVVNPIGPVSGNG